MYLELKEEILDIIEIAQKCPENLQEKCFEMLLSQYMSEHKAQREQNVAIEGIMKDNIVEGEIVESAVSERSINDSSSDEIKLSDFHIKIQKFFSSNGITILDINNLYYKEDGKLMPLYESLGSTKMSECQIRLELLTAFENSFSSMNGDMSFNGEEVRQRCQTMKCYDTANFSTILKKSGNLLDNFSDKYDKNTEYILSAEGKKELAKIILELVKDI